MPGCPRRSPGRLVHPDLEVLETLLGQRDFAARHSACPFLEGVEQNKEVGRAAVQDPIEVAAKVAAQLAELALDLARVREGQ